MTMIESVNCRLCDSKTEFLINFGHQPIVNNLSLKPNNVKKFPIEVIGCPKCGLVQYSEAIDPFEFYTNYANSSSVKREPHVENLLLCLKNFLKPEAQIIDVGCNDGKFMKILQNNGFKNIYGLEPSKNMSDIAIASEFNIFNSFLDFKKSNEIISKTGKFDCIILRQVLEHIFDLQNFGLSLRNLLKPNGLIAIEVPNAEPQFLTHDYSLWEEHVNHFSLESLKYFLEINGFKILKSYSSQFSGVCLTVIAKLSNDCSSSTQAKSIIADSFRIWAEDFLIFQNRVQNEIQSFIEKGSQVGLYGVGARSSFFLNVMQVTQIVAFAIDDDLNKQGKYLPGTKIPILSRTEAFQLLKNDSLVLLGVNRENEAKLLAEIRPLKKCTYKSILPPSNNLLLAFDQ